ncbi:hypothetical protein H112_02859 [Trichophyton rubrum D6]|uniref:Uncharacterized protein n=1 Tax=Trichophyton rubrum CBS 288.86 TaxID=1215330 RepID=A0A022W8L6_TRIRU|nr:hypothetical protein H103_02871 [Trichophyton rubrum CBS 288.86]EZF86327.1 hypothetical protein H110_02870 [Trichophyton rubrum MR1448]KDB35437.1 hypothetical protein H112_02859 [Trichophyton rubrum D6]
MRSHVSLVLIEKMTRFSALGVTTSIVLGIGNQVLTGTQGDAQFPQEMGKLKRVSRTTNELSRITTSAVQSTSNFDKDMWSLAQHRDILIPRFTPTTTTTALMDHKLHCAALSNMLPCSTQAFGSPAPLVPGAGPTPSTKILQGLIKLALSNLFDI